MSKNKIFIILGALILVLASYLVVDLLTENSEHTGDVTVVHELGTTYVNKNPKKVVVFDFGILETLDELDINVVGLPKDSLPSHLQKYNTSQVTNIGTLFEPNFEVIHNLKPDLIIISARQSALFDQLNELAPTIYLPMDNLKFLESFKKNLNVLSQIFTRNNHFADYIEEIEEKIAALHEITSSSELNGLILMVNSSEISALGIGSRYDVVHTAFGVKPADSNIKVSTHGQVVNFEYILDVNPDIIFVIDRGIITEGQGTAQSLLNNSLVNQTNAAKNNKIVYLNAENWYISTGGFDSFKVMIEEVQSAFTK